MCPPRQACRFFATQASGSSAKSPAPHIRLPENPAHWGRENVAQQVPKVEINGAPPTAPDGKPFGSVTIKVVGVGGGGVNTVNNMIERGFEGAASLLHD